MRRLLALLVILPLLAVSVLPVQAQTPFPPAYVMSVLNGMTPEERVGQLFLAAFNGRDIGAASQAYDLIVNYHIGGVVLRASNDNFAPGPDTATETYNLISQLQTLNRVSATPAATPTSGGNQTSSGTYIPLWIGIDQEGNGAPTDQILHGLTPLPSEMALGATWQPSLAQQVGTVAGQELSALGFNLFLGPSLDVLEMPILNPDGDLGTRVFGGDPFWVGELGRAYIRGLHLGSDNQMLVLSTHFPGRGSSDRLPEVEVSTVRKSLEQLKQVELAPFFFVTGDAPTALETTDGLLVSHTRFQGLQGNIRATTRPLSFDPQALSEILKLPEFSTWMANGGLIVSDDLGSQAVVNFYAASGTAFNARLIARDAFLAGNDMLYLGNIVSNDAPDTHTTVTQILNYFAQKYREDSAFAQRVDAAAARILGRKYQMYGNFNQALVVPDANRLTTLNTSQSTIFQVAASAATLVSPDLKDLDAVLPSPPVAADYIVFLTDTSQTRQCSTCPDEPNLATDALQQAILRLYGTPAGGQVIPSHLTSYTFKDLSNLLDGTGGEFVGPDLQRAQWVVISLTDTRNNQPQLISRFLASRQDLLRNKKVILFSFGAPYYFDSTDISKMSAYFALYSKIPPFVEVAARILFQEISPSGASPVSIPGIDYDLVSITQPDPNQIISLFLDQPSALTPTPAASLTAEPTIPPPVLIGDTVIIRTGTLLDHNGHVVPDGTVVNFSISLGGTNGGLIQQQNAQTVNGVARISYRLEKPGLLEIRASSDPATISQVLQLDVLEGEPVVVTVIVPVISTADTATAVPTTSVPVQENDFVTTTGKPRFGGWLLILFILGGGAALSYWVGGRLGSARWRLRWALCTLLGGLLVYNYLALSLPGATETLVAGGGGALVGLTIMGEFFGAVGAWMWMRAQTR